MLKRVLIAFVIGILCARLPADASSCDGGYGGLEFFGSSQITRAELEKDLGLKPGSQCDGIKKAIVRLKDRLEKKRVDAEVTTVNEGGYCYVSVDVMNPGSESVAVRKLISPHRVTLSNNLAFTLLSELFQRITLLQSEGRPTTENLVEGIKQFADEPCNQLAKKLLMVVPPVRNELFEIMASDPDPIRRSFAVEALNWDRQQLQDCLDVMPALDDAADQVRASACRYVTPRLKFLPDNFPIPELADAFSRQLMRPSHRDRTLALRGLVEIARTHPFAARAILQLNAPRLHQLEQESLLSSIKQPAHELLQMSAQLPEPAKTRRPAQLNEF